MVLLERAGAYLEKLLEALLIVIIACVRCMFECRHTCPKVHLWRSKDNFQKSVFSLHPVPEVRYQASYLS